MLVGGIDVLVGALVGVDVAVGVFVVVAVGVLVGVAVAEGVFVGMFVGVGVSVGVAVGVLGARTRTKSVTLSLMGGGPEGLAVTMTPVRPTGAPAGTVTCTVKIQLAFCTRLQLGCDRTALQPAGAPATLAAREKVPAWLPALVRIWVNATVVGSGRVASLV